MEHGLVLFVAVVLFVTVALGLMYREAREAARTYERIRNLRVPGPEVRVADLSDVDFDAEQPPLQVPHVHIWSSQPVDADQTSQTYKCQVPHCGRVHTVMR